MTAVRLWLGEPGFRPYLSDVGVGRDGFGGAFGPVAYVGFRADPPSSPRISAASGQSAANARLTRLAVSLIRTAIFNNRSHTVELSALANGCGCGMTLRERQLVRSGSRPGHERSRGCCRATGAHNG